jgi:hypothetical protein
LLVPCAKDVGVAISIIKNRTEKFFNTVFIFSVFIYGTNVDSDGRGRKLYIGR